jgi:hypothetical protein
MGMNLLWGWWKAGRIEVLFCVEKWRVVGENQQFSFLAHKVSNAF